MTPEEVRDEGIIEALLNRLNRSRLPRILDLHERVKQGEKLNERDLAFLDEALKDAHHTEALAQRHPEFMEIRARIIHLYNEITGQALKNEQKP